VHNWQRYNRTGPPVSSEVLQLFIPPTAPRITILKVLFRSNQVSGVLLVSSPSLYRICYIQSYTNTTCEILWNSWNKSRISATPAIHFVAVHISVLFAQAPYCKGVEVSICVCIYIYTHIRTICVCVYIYIYIHTRTYTHVVNSLRGGDRFWSSHSGRFTAGLKPPVPLA